MVENIEGSKSEADLIEVLERYPNVRIVEEGEYETFSIEELDVDEPRQLDVTFSIEGNTGHMTPLIFHKIPGTRDSMHIVFLPSGAEAHGGKGQNLHEIMRLAKAGLEIMQVYKQIPQSEREELGDKYADRVYDDGQSEGYTEEWMMDCMEKTLSAIRQALGE